MQFLFVCPETGQSFETHDFRLIDHQGIKTDKAGHRYLDAKVELMSPCPFCGKKHVFHADELTCPFAPAGRNQQHTE